MSTEDKNKFAFKVFSFSEPTDLPTFKVANNKQYFNYGEKDNSYPLDLIDIYHTKSNKHKAIINRKSELVGSNGWNKEGLDPATLLFLNNISDKDTLDDILYKLSFDLEIFNGFAVIVKWSNDGTKIGAIKYVPFQNLLVSTEENKYWFSKDWSQKKKEENTPVELQGYDPSKAFEQPLQVFYFKQYSPAADIYPIPSYSSSLNWIECDSAISNFHLSSIEQGFTGGFLINMATGVPTEEEMDRNFKEFKKNYVGTQNGGNIIMTYSDGQDSRPMFEPLELNASDERFILLSEQIMQEIFIGSGVVNPQLFGVMLAGQLAGRTEIEEGLAIFQSVYVNPKQKSIERVFNRFTAVNNLQQITINKYTL